MRHHQSHHTHVLHEVYDCVLSFGEFVRITTSPPCVSADFQCETKKRKFPSTLKKKKKKKEKLSILRNQCLPHDALVCLNRPIPVLSLSSTCFSTKEIIHKCVKDLFKRAAFPENLLAKGHRQIVMGGHSELEFAPGVTCWYPNTLHNVLEAPPWSKVHELFGDEFFKCLLMRTAVFVPLQNHCYYQLTGRPLNADVLSMRGLLRAKLSTSRSTLQIHLSRNIGPANSSLPHSRAPCIKVDQSCIKVDQSCIKGDQSCITGPRASPCGASKRRAIEAPHPSSTRTLISTTPRARTRGRPITPLCSVGQVVERGRIFYGLTRNIRAGLPPNHEFNRVNVSKRGVRRILGVVLGLGLQPLRLTQRQRALSPTITHVLSRHKSTNYAFLLEYHCPLPILENGTFVPSCARKHATLSHEKPSSPADQGVLSEARLRSKQLRAGEDGGVAGLLGLFVPHRQVAGFVKAVVRRVAGGDAVWNGQSDGRDALRRLCDRVDEFVRLGRHETMGWSELSHGIRESAMRWKVLCDAPRHAEGASWTPRLTTTRRSRRRRRGAGRVPRDRTRRTHPSVAHRFIGWLFSRLVVPLLRHNFYITESSGYGHRVFYYRKPVWRRVQRIALAREFPKTFVQIPSKSAAATLKGRNTGYSFVRFLPKASGGLRPIINLARRPATTTSSSSSSSCMVPRGGKRSSRRRSMMHGTTSKDNAQRDRVLGKQSRSINGQLKPLHQVLTWERARRPEVAGASVFGLQDIYRRLVRFRWRLLRFGECNEGPHRLPRLFLVCADVRRAFDTVKQRRLMEKVLLEQRLISRPSYIIGRYAASRLVHRLGRMQVAFRSRVIGDVRNQQFPKLSAREVEQRNMKCTLLSDQVGYTRVERSWLHQLAREHLFFNIVQHEGIWYRQRQGIPQGSILSTLLASLFYGHMERTDPVLSSLALADEADGPPRTSNVRRDVSTDMDGRDNLGRKRENWRSRTSDDGVKRSRTSDDGVKRSRTSDDGVKRSRTSYDSSPSHVGLLIRMTDDFLYVTTSLCMARTFVDRLNRGLPEYGCTINPRKTRANFPLQDGGEGASPLDQDGMDDADHFISWCGLLVNSQTLAIRYDYSRYAGTYLRDEMTIKRHQPGVRLRQTMLSILSLKLVPLLLDENHNGTFIVRLNIYQTFYWAAMKFCVFVRCFPTHLGDPRPAMLAGVVQDMVDYAHRLVMARTGSCSALAKEMRCSCKVSFKEIAWLALRAFKSVVKRKHTRLRHLYETICEWHRRITRLLGKRSGGGGGQIRLLCSVARSQANEELESVLF